MDIGDDGNGALRAHAPKGFQRLTRGNAHTHNITTHLGERTNLRERGFSVSRRRTGHRLDHDRCAATDLHVANHNGTRQITGK